MSNQKKRDLMSELVGDAYRYVPAPPTCSIPNSKVSVLAATVDVLSRNTKHRQDALDIIKGCYPDYFKNEQ